MSTARAASHLTPWVQYARPTLDARMVLVCLPFAGGAASGYRGWTSALADYGIEVWPVQLPGRESRFSEPMSTDLEAVTSTLAELLHSQLAGRPYALYGHSAGAFMAYALAVRAAAAGRPAPYHLFVGACRPLSAPDPDFPIHQLPRDPFVARLFSYGRMPAELLDYPDIADAAIATARADLALIETHPWSSDMVVDCPVTAFGGAADTTVPVEYLDGWQQITRGAFQSIVLPGGHFPPPDAERRLLEVVRHVLS